MMRVGPWLARGIVLAAVLAASHPLSDSSTPPVERALSVVRAQNHAPLINLAGVRIREYFLGLRENDFLDEVFSASGKWKAVTRTETSYRRYVRRAFEKHLLNPGSFASLLEKIREDYAFAVTASENRVVAVLFEDLRAGRSGLEFGSFRAEYDRLAAELAPAILNDLGMNLVSLAGSEVASALLVAALTSAGILGASTTAGASTGLVTFGVGLVVGIGVGVAVDAFTGEAYEDAARMELRRHLNGLRNRVIDGVYDSLVRALEAHRRIQERCVRALFEGGRREHVSLGP